MSKGKLSQEELDALLGNEEKNEDEKEYHFTEFVPAEMENSAVNQMNLDVLLNIPLEIVVELGRTQKKVSEVLALTNGSIVELERVTGEPVDVYINNKLVAKGEVVVVEDHFGVRITEICQTAL